MIKCPACGYANYAADAVACELCHAKLKGGAPPKGAPPPKGPPPKGAAANDGDLEALAAAASEDTGATATAPPKGKAGKAPKGGAPLRTPRAVLSGGGGDEGPTSVVDLLLFILALPASLPLAAWTALARNRDWAGVSGWAWVVQGVLILGMVLGVFLSGGADRPAWAGPLLAALSASALAGCALLIRIREPGPGWAGIGGLAAVGTVVVGLSVMGGGGDGIEVNGQVVAMASQGNQLVTGGDALLLFDAPTGKLVRTLETGRKLGAVALGPTLAAAGGAEEGTVHLWSTKDGAQVRSFAAARTGVMALALTESPEQRLAVGSLTGEVVIVNAVGKTLRGPTPHVGAITALAWSPDGRRLASVGADKVVSIYDVEERRDRGLDGHEQAILCVAWSPDGKRLATGAEDGKVRLWDLSGGGQKPVVLASTAGLVRGVAFVGNDRLVSIHEARAATLWDVARAVPVGHVALRALPVGVAAAPPPAGGVLIGLGRSVRRFALADFKP